MKINPSNPGLDLLKHLENNSQPNKGAEKKHETKKDEYVPGDKEKVNTYEKDITRLKEKSEEAYKSLRIIVTQLLERQGYTVEKLESKDPDYQVEIDETARKEAAELIADDGPLGAEAVSQRIVDFALAISGGDKSRLDKLKGAIDQAFQEVENKLGALPEVSQDTYDLIMEKLDRWAEE